MATDTVRFGVNIDRKTDGEIEEIAKGIEKRPKVDFHRKLCRRVAKLWRERPEACLELGIIRRGE